MDGREFKLGRLLGGIAAGTAAGILTYPMDPKRMADAARHHPDRPPPGFKQQLSGGALAGGVVGAALSLPKKKPPQPGDPGVQSFITGRRRKIPKRNMAG